MIKTVPNTNVMLKKNKPRLINYTKRSLGKCSVQDLCNNIGDANRPPYPLSDADKSKAERKAYRRTRRAAKKDAKEYARAKMYYGKRSGQSPKAN